MPDTNALSAIFDGDKALGQVLRGTGRFNLSAIVLGEYLYGIKSSRFRRRYEIAVANLLTDANLLLIDDDTARHYAEIRQELKAKGRPIPANDLWIAAQARQHGLGIVSRDAHFDAVEGLARLSW